MGGVGAYAANAVLERTEHTTTSAGCEASANTIKVKPGTVQALAETILNTYANSQLSDDRRSETTTLVHPANISTPLSVETRAIALGGFPSVPTESVRAGVSFRLLPDGMHPTPEAAKCFGILHNVEVDTDNLGQETDYTFAPAGVGEWTVTVTHGADGKTNNVDKINSIQVPGEFQQALDQAQTAVTEAPVIDQHLR